MCASARVHGVGGFGGENISGMYVYVLPSSDRCETPLAFIFISPFTTSAHANKHTHTEHVEIAYGIPIPIENAFFMSECCQSVEWSGKSAVADCDCVMVEKMRYICGKSAAKRKCRQ